MLSVSGGNRTGDPGRFGQAPFAGERGLLVAVIYVNPLVVGGAQWLIDQELDSLGGRGRSNGLAVVVGGFSQPQVGAHV